MNKNGTLFLDIDGVLVSLRSHLAHHGCSERGSSMLDFDTMGVIFLRNFCETFHFEIVVSSTWRFHEKRCKDALNSYGLIDYLHHDWRTGRDIDGKRGWEVKTWLEAHPEVDKYLIIDDDTDFLPEQFGFLINTPFSEGICSGHMKDMIERAQMREWLPDTERAQKFIEDNQRRLNRPPELFCPSCKKPMKAGHTCEMDEKAEKKKGFICSECGKDMIEVFVCDTPGCIENNTERLLRE